MANESASTGKSGTRSTLERLRDPATGLTADRLAAVTESADRLIEFIERLTDIERLADVTVKALNSLERSVPLHKALADMHVQQYPHDAEQQMKALTSIQNDAEFATKQQASGYSAVYAQVLVSTWGALESYVDDQIATLLHHDKSFFKDKPLCEAKIKLEVIEYETLGTYERMEAVANALLRDSGGPLRRGVDQFEGGLKKLGLTGDVPKEVWKCLHECCAVRNVLVHRRSLIDRAALEACPWMRFVSGKPVVVTETMCSSYLLAACVYACLIQQRVKKHYGVASKSLDEMTTHFAEHFDTTVASHRRAEAEQNPPGDATSAEGENGDQASPGASAS